MKEYEEEAIKIAVYEGCSGRICILEYDRTPYDAPTVKERRFISDEKELLDIKWDMITIYDNPPLARLLYHTVDNNDEINPELYQAIAELFAMEYNNEMGAGIAKDD